MFTGLISEVGTVLACKWLHQHTLSTITIHAPQTATDLLPGSSVAVQGICLTVTQVAGNHFTVAARGDSLLKTTITELKRGSMVNLEPALLASGRLDGHVVQGHVQGTGTVMQLQKSPAGALLVVAIPPRLLASVQIEGSIAIDGVSLTIAEVRKHPTSPCIRISVIPHTLKHSTLALLAPKAKVNLETDILARMHTPLQESIFAVPEQPKRGLSMQKLKTWGYV